MSATYKVEITVHGGRIIEIKNLTQVQLLKVQEVIWSQGWRVLIKAGEWELLSPYIIQKVIFKKEQAE